MGRQDIVSIRPRFDALALVVIERGEHGWKTWMSGALNSSYLAVDQQLRQWAEAKGVAIE